MEHQPKLGKTCLIWVENHGLMQDNSFFLTHLAHLRLGEVYFDPTWTLYFIKTTVTGYNYAQFFIQYHPIDKKSNLVIALPENRKKDLQKLIECLKHDEVKNVRQMVHDGHLEEIHRCQEQVKVIYKRYHLE